LNKFFKDIFTENDGESYCMIRLPSSFGFLHYLFLGTVDMFKNCSNFSLQDMAIGISSIIGVASAGISLKNKTDNQ
jgi:hypothetical protein